MSATGVNANPKSRLLLTEIELLAWLGQASLGERLVYHRGFLAMDRVPIRERTSESDALKLSRVATLAWRAAELGIADLVQRRLGPDDFNYLIVARERRPEALEALLTATLDGPVPTEMAEAA